MFEALFNLIRAPFGILYQWLYTIFDSYFVAILLFAVILKIVMFPIGIKQQKNSQKQAALRPKENVIRKKYAGRNDRATQMKMNTEIQELYQKENFSPFGGCLPMLVQMLVLLAVYAVVRNPLTYAAPLPEMDGFDTAESVKHTISYVVYQNDAEKADDQKQVSLFLNGKVESESQFWELLKAGKYNIYSEINAIDFLRSEENRNRFIEAYNSATHYKGDGTAVSVKDGSLTVTAEQVLDTIPNLELFPGFDLGLRPNLSVLKGEQIGEKLLIIIPILTLVTAYFGQALTRKFTYQPEVSAELQSQNRMMNIMMPLMSLFIAYSVPTAVGIYWMIQNILSPVQQIILAKAFPIKEISPEEMREAERLYGGKVKKKKSAATAKKKKSLVYDDDDEYESVSTVSEKTVLKEKKTGDNSPVGKAPLKDDEKK